MSSGLKKGTSVPLAAGPIRMVALLGAEKKKNRGAFLKKGNAHKRNGYVKAEGEKLKS